MRKSSLIALSLILLLLGCAAVSKLIQKPSVTFQKARLTDFSFSDLTLNIDLAVRNPNPIGVSLAGYDYEFMINNKKFLAGEATQKVRVLANATSTVSIPIGIKFKKLYELFSAAKSSDELPYQVAGHVLVNLPIGPFRIPFSAKGKLPTVKIPKISIQNVKVESFSFSGIKLNLGVNVDNPNSFGFSMANFNYDINLSGKKAISGKTVRENVIPKKGKGTINIPVQLDFISIGSILTEALRKGNINYNLTGGGDFKTEFGSVKLPIAAKGLAKIWK